MLVPQLPQKGGLTRSKRKPSSASLCSLSPGPSTPSGSCGDLVRLNAAATIQRAWRRKVRSKKRAAVVSLASPPKSEAQEAEAEAEESVVRARDEDEADEWRRGRTRTGAAFRKPAAPVDSLVSFPSHTLSPPGPQGLASHGPAGGLYDCAGRLSRARGWPSERTGFPLHRECPLRRPVLHGGPGGHGTSPARAHLAPSGRRKQCQLPRSWPQEAGSSKAVAPRDRASHFFSPRALHLRLLLASRPPRADPAGGG